MPITPAAWESKEHLLTVWADLVRDRGGRIGDENGVAHMWADSTFGFWNTVTLTGADTQPDALTGQLDHAASFMRERAQPGYLWVFEELLSPPARKELMAGATRSGLTLAFSGRGMAGDLRLPEPEHPDLEFRRVSSAADLAAYGELNAAAYGMDLAVGREALAGSALWRDEAYAFLGLRNGIPVTCAATIARGNTIFLALVATTPAETRHGYGEAVTRKAIHEGLRQTGLRRVVLHATAAGQPVYERIGCRPNTPIHFFQLTEGASYG